MGYTIGKSGDDYWSHSVHMCCTYEWIVSGGTNFNYASIGGGQRTGQHKCMVGYMNGPEGSNKKKGLDLQGARDLCASFGSDWSTPSNGIDEDQGVLYCLKGNTGTGSN